MGEDVGLPTYIAGERRKFAFASQLAVSRAAGAAGRRANVSAA